MNKVWSIVVVFVFVVSMICAKQGFNVSPQGAEAMAVPGDLEEQAIFDIGLGVTMEFALIPAGSFIMGSSGAMTSHQVTLTQPFYMGIYEVTQEQYQAVMGHNPSHAVGLDQPVEWVSWNDAMDFCKKMSDITHMKVALPTEAQWEYACKGGSQTRFCFGDQDSDLGDYAWYRENSEGQIHPVGQKRPNAFGLYDMHGNVWEWCRDGYRVDYDNLPSVDPVKVFEGLGRVNRGGGCYSIPSWCRSFDRYAHHASGRAKNLGFRVVVVPAGQ